MPLKQAWLRNLTVTDHSLKEGGEGGWRKWVDIKMRTHQTKAESNYPQSLRFGGIKYLKLELFLTTDKTNSWSSTIPSC